MKASRAFFLVFLIVLSLCVVSTQPVKADGPIYIRPDGSVEGTDKIRRDGNIYTLTGNIDVFNPWTHVGAGIWVERNNIVIDGAGYSLQAFHSDPPGMETGIHTGIDLKGRSNVTVKNMQIKYFTHGFNLDQSSGNTILGNNIIHPTASSGYQVGFWVWNSSNNNIIENRITSFNEYGILLQMSDNNIISGNYLTNNNRGIFLEFSRNNVLRNNHMNSNTRNFNVEGGSLAYFIQDIDTSNTVDGKPIYYWVDQQDKTVPSNAGYVALINCMNITVQDLVFSNSNSGTPGITLVHTQRSLITRNNIRYRSEGIRLLCDSEANRIIGNCLANNNYGISINQVSKSNVILRNNITNNGNGIYSDSSANQIIYHNNFINNTIQVGDAGISPFPLVPLSVYTWDNGEEGNFWSDYAGMDKDGDGIGDTVYHINSQFNKSNQDFYPLMKPIDISDVEIPPIPEVPDTTPPTISIVSPENKTYSVNHVSLTFTVNEQSSWIGYSLDGEENFTITENTTLTGLSNGLHTLTVYANFTFGSTAASKTIYFTIAQKESFPITLIVATTVIIPIAVFGAALLFYFEKVRKTTGKVEK